MKKLIIFMLLVGSFSSFANIVVGIAEVAGRVSCNQNSRVCNLARSNAESAIETNCTEIGRNVKTIEELDSFFCNYSEDSSKPTTWCEISLKFSCQ